MSQPRWWQSLYGATAGELLTRFPRPDSLLAPLFFAHFLRLRYYLSPPTRKAFAWVSNRVDEYTARNSKCPPVVTKAVKVVRELVSPPFRSLRGSRIESPFLGGFGLDARVWDRLRGLGAGEAENWLSTFDRGTRQKGVRREERGWGWRSAEVDARAHQHVSYSFTKSQRLTLEFVRAASTSADHPLLGIDHLGSTTRSGGSRSRRCRRSRRSSWWRCR